MDLLERGRSLSELGRTLTWSDMWALIRSLPERSYTYRLLHPQQAEKALWNDPQVLMLGAIFDLIERNFLLDRGVQPDPDTRGIIGRVTSTVDGPTDTKNKPSPVSREKKALSIAQQIRAGG